MKTELLRHFEILKTVPEIKESIEDLKFGCFVKNHGSENRFIGTYIDEDGDLVYKLDFSGRYETSIKPIIIGQIHEGHLRMFGVNNMKQIKIDGYGCILYVEDGLTKSAFLDGEYIQLDNTKPYMDQSSDFLKKLNDWLVKEFNIKL